MPLSDRSNYPKLEISELKEPNEHTIALNEICKVMNLQNYKQIIDAIKKMERVIKAVPRLEKFITNISDAVYSNTQIDPKNRSIEVS